MSWLDLDYPSCRSTPAERIYHATQNYCQLEIWLTASGRDLLVKKLQSLSERNDHLHIGSREGNEVRISSKAYRPDDTIIKSGKFLFRTDEWGRKYYPHVLSGPA